MGSFAFKLEHEDGTPADPPVLHTAYRRGMSATRFRWDQIGRFASSAWSSKEIADHHRRAHWPRRCARLASSSRTKPASPV